MKYIKLVTERKQLKVFFYWSEFDKELVTKIKKIPLIKFDGTDKTWKVKVNQTTVKYIYLFSKYHKFDIPTEFEKLYTQYQNQNKLNEELSKAKESTFQIKPNYNGTPYPFQIAGVEFLINNSKRAFMGDEQGLGKTIQTILSIHHLDLFPLLIICPNTLRHNWKTEFKMWLPYITDNDIGIVSRKSSIEEYQKKIVLCNYDIFSRVKPKDPFILDLKKLNFKLLVLDESHYCKNSKSNRTKSIISVSKFINNKILLSGTGSTGRNVDLVSQLNILGVLKEFGGSTAFKDRYCDPQISPYGMTFSGNTNNEELHTKLRQICYLRRNKKDVLLDLPDKIRSAVYIEIDNMKKYKKAELDIVKYVLDLKLNDEEILKSLEGLDPKIRKLTLDSISMETKTKTKMGKALIELQKLNEIILEGKTKGIIEWVENFFESTNNQKLVLFANRTKFIKTIASHFKCDFITGEVELEDRQKIINDFQTNPSKKLLILNEKIGSVGITLTAASYLAFCEIPDRPNTINQSEDRIHRIGQKNVANIYFFVGKDTINETHYNKVIELMKITNTVNAGIKDETIIHNSYDVRYDIFKSMITNNNSVY